MRWLHARDWPVPIAVGVTLLVALGLAVLVLPHVLVAGIQLSPMDLAKAQSDARANLIAAWGGLAIGVAGVGTYLTYRWDRTGCRI